jgi:hypothetical protein
MKRITLTFILFLATFAAMPLRAQISAFTYQGRLDLNGAPANGYYDFMFRLLNDPTNGVVAPVIPVNLAVLVTNGLFTTGMDFGAENFNGANRWLEINVRTNGGGPFTTLAPRQLLTPSPYAVAANTASNLLGILPASQISGTIPNASLPASPSFSGTVTANNFSGNGNGLTNVNAATVGGLNSSDFWRTTGNAGTTPDTHFLGTTDNQPLEIRVNWQRGLRIEPTFNGRPNIIAGAADNSTLPTAIAATIGGGYLNSIGAAAGTIAGGEGNSAAPGAEYAAIGGGANNQIHYQAFAGTIGGGYLNIIEDTAFSGTIGGGERNTIATNADTATIGGGAHNAIEIGNDGATIGGGWSNRIEPSADYATIAGGIGNIISTNAEYATIPGGASNSATNRAFAAGSRAKANHQGAFVWGDSNDADIASTNANSVTMRASGGYRFFSDSTTTTGAFLAAGSGSWTSMSDRNAKENFHAADAREVLAKVVALPVQTWNFRSQDTSIRHIGPMAQDFKAAFAVGESSTGISTVDADGVALAAIQGLNQKLEQTRTENAELRARLAELEQVVRKFVAQP